MDLLGYLVFGVVFILSMIVQNSLKSKFAKYSRIPLGVPMAGRDIANAMLQQNGCGDVQVTSVSGQLTDHFNPANRTVNLSEPVYATNSIAAAAVAAHECGHAIQHKVGYSMLQLRTKMVPIVSFASRTVQWLLLAGYADTILYRSCHVWGNGIVQFCDSACRGRCQPSCHPVA